MSHKYPASIAMTIPAQVARVIQLEVMTQSFLADLSITKTFVTGPTPAVRNPTIVDIRMSTEISDAKYVQTASIESDAAPTMITAVLRRILSISLPHSNDPIVLAIADKNIASATSLTPPP